MIICTQPSDNQIDHQPPETQPETSFFVPTKAGEIIVLPIVVLISLMAQPRLLYVMAKDGLLPRAFAETAETFGMAWSLELSWC